MYMSIKKDEFDELKEEAAEEYRDSNGDEDKGYEFPQLNIDIGEVYRDGDELHMSASMGNNLGYISMNIPLSIDLAIDLMEYYEDKIRKIRDILQPLKE